MSAPFAQTLAFLEAEGKRRLGWFVLGAAVLLGGAVAWLAVARTTVYAVSEEGRLLAAGAASPLQTPVSGVIVATHLVLGAEVNAGDVLVELDSAADELRRDEERAKHEGLVQAARSLDRIVEAERRLAAAAARAGASRVRSAAERARVSAEIAVLTKQQDDAVQRLREASLVSGLDGLKSAEQLRRERGQATLARADTALASADDQRDQKETDVRLLSLEREVLDLQARAATSAAVTAQLDWAIARRKLRAPVAGVIADVVALPVGAAVAENESFATIVPRTKMRWVAYFPVRDAVGRIHAGQAARIRLDAFPWTAYGALDATVLAVGSESHDQRVRVEIAIDAAHGIPLTHGMTGSADVRVEEMSPLRVMLRLSGQVVDDAGRRAPPVAPETVSLARPLAAPK